MPVRTRRLAYRPPYDFGATRTFLAARAVPGVEEVVAGTYRRTARLDGAPAVLAVTPSADGPWLRLEVDAPATVDLAGVVARARRVFDLDAEPRAVRTALARDARLAPLVRARPGLRVPGAFDPFELAVRAVLGQQISVAGARTLAARLVEAFGERLAATRGTLTRLFPTPCALADADVARVGLPRARAEAIRGLARAAAGSEGLFEAPSGLDDFVSRFVALPGVGAWTAHYVALRALFERDAFPSGDLVLRRQASRGEEALTAAALERRAERWRPFRAYAAIHLWHSASDGNGKETRG